MDEIRSFKLGLGTLTIAAAIMAAVNTRQRAKRVRHSSESLPLSPYTSKRQCLQEPQERTFSHFMCLPTELKLRVFHYTDIYALKGLAASCSTMWKLWQENMEGTWTVIIKERYPLESEVVGPVKSYPSFRRRRDGETACRRTSEQEGIMEGAVEAVLRRRYYPFGFGHTLDAPSLDEVIRRVRKGGIGYLELLEEMKARVDTDVKTLQWTGLLGTLEDPTKRLGYRDNEKMTPAGESEDEVDSRIESEFLASVGMTNDRNFRPALMLLWRMQWWRVEGVFDPTTQSLTKRVFRKMTDDERLHMVTEVSVQTRENFKILLEALAWKLAKVFGLDRLCRKAVAEELALEKRRGGDRHVHRFQALLHRDIDLWLRKEVIEWPLTFILEQARDPRADFGWTRHKFCRQKILSLRRRHLGETMTAEELFEERRNDLVSRMSEILKGSTVQD